MIHPALRQLELALAEPQEADGEGLDIGFLHKSFCLSGLPIRPPLEKKSDGDGDRKELSYYSRTSEHASLTLNAPTIPIQGGRNLAVGLPWGAKARLLILWMTTSARSRSASEDRWLELGTIKEFLADVGVPYNTDAIGSVKEQLIRLSFARFTMSLTGGGFQFFRDESLFDAAVFGEGDLTYYADRDFSQIRFPEGLKLSERAWQRFSGNDTIPVPTRCLRTISNNAMALDLFVYLLCYRLPLIPQGETSLVSWKSLIRQFGSGREAVSRFRQVFEPSLMRALEAYETARVDVTDEGVVLHHGDPLEWRRLYTVSARPIAGKPKRTLKRVMSPLADTERLQSSMEF